MFHKRKWKWITYEVGRGNFKCKAEENKKNQELKKAELIANEDLKDKISDLTQWKKSQID